MHKLFSCFARAASNFSFQTVVIIFIFIIAIDHPVFGSVWNPICIFCAAAKIRREGRFTSAFQIFLKVQVPQLCTLLLLRRLANGPHIVKIFFHSLQRCKHICSEISKSRKTPLSRLLCRTVEELLHIQSTSASNSFRRLYRSSASNLCPASTNHSPIQNQPKFAHSSFSSGSLHSYMIALYFFHVFCLRKSKAPEKLPHRFMSSCVSYVKKWLVRYTTMKI